MQYSHFLKYTYIYNREKQVFLKMTIVFNMRYMYHFF